MLRVGERVAWGILGALALALAAVLAGVTDAGPLEPPNTGPPASTDGVRRAGTPISSLPFTIDTSGSYYLTRNLQRASGSGITIAADRVTLDLNGFALTGTTTGIGIAASILVRDVVIENGSIQGWATGLSGVNLVRSRAADLRVSGNGTGLTMGPASIVERVVAVSNNLNGIALSANGAIYTGGEVRDSLASSNGQFGIYVSVEGATVRNNTVSDNADRGITVFGTAKVLIDGNRVYSNGAVAGDAGILPGAGTAVIRNRVGANVPTQIATVGYRAPTIASLDLASSNPFANYLSPP